MLKLQSCTMWLPSKPQIN